MLLVLPSLKTDKEEAVAILEKILRLGDNLLGIDPLAEVRSQEDGIERVRNACNEMRTRTKQWADDALLQVNGLFTRHVISSFQLINTTDLYPRLSHLRDILHSIKASGSQTDTPIDRGKAFQELHPKILRRCRKSFEIGQFDDALGRLTITSV